MGTVRAMVLSEVGADLQSSDELVLLRRGKAIPREDDGKSLEDLGFSNNQLVVISRKLGGDCKSMTRGGGCDGLGARA